MPPVKAPPLCDPEIRARGPVASKILTRSFRVSETLAIQSDVRKRMTNPKLSAAALAHLVRAWDTLEDRLRELRGLPKAGFLRPEKQSKRKGALGIVPMSAPGAPQAGEIKIA